MKCGETPFELGGGGGGKAFENPVGLSMYDGPTETFFNIYVFALRNFIFFVRFRIFY